MMNAGVPGWGSPASLIGRRHARVGSDLEDEGAAAEGSRAEEGATWKPVERELLEAALDFYGAAQGVIAYEGPERPHLRHDAAGFDAVRKAMAALEARVVAAHGAGMGPARIAEIARMEPEMVALILERHAAPPHPPEG
jgi:hypothetical protein